MFMRVFRRYTASAVLVLQHLTFTDAAHSVRIIYWLDSGRQTRGDNQCPFNGITNTAEFGGRVQGSASWSVCPSLGCDTILYNVSTRCQCHCTRNVLWCQVHSSRIHRGEKSVRINT